MTTAAKTLVVLLGDTVFCVVHAKEPKTDEAARTLVAYLQALVADGLAAATKMLRYECTTWCVLSDTNLAKEKLATTFQNEFGDGASVVPRPADFTTTKHVFFDFANPFVRLFV